MQITDNGEQDVIFNGVADHLYEGKNLKLSQFVNRLKNCNWFFQIFKNPNKNNTRSINWDTFSFNEFGHFFGQKIKKDNS